MLVKETFKKLSPNNLTIGERLNFFNAKLEMAVHALNLQNVGKNYKLLSR